MLNIWNTAWPIAVAVLLFCLVVFVHELGHFSWAKFMGVKVNEFALGMGPTIFKFTKGETKYALRLLPIGGFCNMEGEDSESEDGRAFHKKPVWRRMLIIVAGAVYNMILGLVFVAIMLAGQPVFPSTTVADFRSYNASSKITGLKTDDKIVNINGKHIFWYNDIRIELMRTDKENQKITVIRDGKKVVLPAVQFPMDRVDDAVFKNDVEIDFFVTPIKNNPLVLVDQSMRQTISMTRFIWQSIMDLATGKFGVKDLSGPVGTADVIGQAAKSAVSEKNMDGLLTVMALITINLGIFNLLPLPALDGGRVVFLLLEAIRRKPVKPEHEGYVHFAGFVLLMLLMLLITFNDVSKKVIELMNGS